MGIATSLKRHCVETVSWQSPVVLVCHRGIFPQLTVVFGERWHADSQHAWGLGRVAPTSGSAEAGSRWRPTDQSPVVLVVKRVDAWLTAMRVGAGLWLRSPPTTSCKVRPNPFKIGPLLDVRNPASRKPLDQAPTPQWGVTVSQGRWFLTGVCSNGFLFAFSQPTAEMDAHWQ